MKEKTLYLECYSGISGDMTVAALLDLGADQKVLLEGLESLKVNGYKIKIGRKAKSNIDVFDFDVILDSEIIHSHQEHYHILENQNHTHGDHSHTHGDHSYSSECYAHTNEDYSHLDYTHETIHESMHDSSVAHLQLGHHEHRNLSDINLIIEQSMITPNAKEIAKKIFQIIAVAESKAHGKPIDEVHFHEVGAIDSIVDIVAAAICLDNLKIQKVIVSELYEGTGQIECQHGIIPIPVPAVANIASEHQLSLHINTNVKGELVTPTGAAIVAAIKTGDTLPREMKILKIGLGAGKRNTPGSTGILRAMLIEDSSLTNEINTIRDQVWVLEANIDDCTGETLSLAMELLFADGAKDVYYAPIYMKKNRPAYLLGVISGEFEVAKLEEIIFTHTTTIGIRKLEVQRTVLPRVQKTISTPYGEAVVKVCAYADKTFVYPEYESTKKLCQQSGIDYLTMYHYIQSSYQE